MCEETAEFSTITGPRDRVQWLMERWEELLLDTGQPELRVRWYDLAELGPEYAEPDCGAVAVALHPRGEATRTAASITAALDLAGEFRLRCEPGHTFAGSAGGGGGGAQLDPYQVQRALAFVPTPPRRAGSRVAVLDTGVDVAANALVDVTNGWPLGGQPVSDPHGHGSAVAQAIRAVTPHADVVPIRVLDASNKGTSQAIYQGLIAALWDGQGCDVVNASFGVDAATACGTALGQTFQYLLTLRRQSWHRSPPPALVVAAGNNRTSLRSPATAVGAYVVPAVDLNGAEATYCKQLTLGPGVQSYPAPGGEKADPLGTYYSGTEIYGTSFAAGFVSGALLA
ncbi:MAG TPA: S8/S53 family peptidase [Mycobacteriales bacterium]|nr:S8/S53 family peptidase [Mycobacteriales bacterium]